MKCVQSAALTYEQVQGALDDIVRLIWIIVD
jgi:hypothetical protein